MKTFTYYDYIKCIHTLRLNAVLQLAEESAEYKIKQKKNKDRHDKLAKSILKDEKEMAKFINDFLEPNEKVESKNLIKYTNSYITRKYNKKEADLVYELENKEIFFLVEHQSTIDHNMPYRMLNYCIDIMQEWSKSRKIKKETKYPIIVPIIIYTGSEKWKMPKNLKEKQIGDYVYENYKISLEYNLIEISKLSTKFLLEKRSMFGYGMIIEKAKNRQELKENLNTIIENIKEKEHLEKIREIVLYLLEDFLEKTTQEKILEKIEIRIEKEEKNMSTLCERLVEELKQDVERERREGREEVAKKLIKHKVEDSIIMDSAQISKKKLGKLKQQVLINQ